MSNKADDLEELEFQREFDEAKRLVDEEMRWILLENPGADEELCTKLLVEACKNDRNLADACVLAASTDLVMRLNETMR